MLPLDFKQVTGKATVIARGRIVALDSQWATERQGIETIVTVQVAAYLKGDLGPQLTFKVPGGKIGRFRSVTVGAPVFQQGEEVILFLGAAGPSMPRVIGFNQGVYRVVTDPQSGVRLVTPPVLSGDVTTPTPLARGDQSRKPVPLRQFEAQVRSLVRVAPDLGGPTAPNAPGHVRK